MIESQMPQTIKSSRNMSMRRVVKVTTSNKPILARRREIGQQFRNRKEYQGKKIDEIELGTSEGEEKDPIKWWNYDIKTLIAIHSAMKEEFAKLGRNQGMKYFD